MNSHKILHIPSPKPGIQKSLCQEMGISGILAQLLINRGITGAAEAVEFLEAKLDYLLDPFTFSQMPKAVELVKKAGSHKEKVMIFGDYDVDGVTALAVIKSTLAKMGIDAVSYVPHRIKEGYGLSQNIAKDHDLFFMGPGFFDQFNRLGHLGKGKGVKEIIEFCLQECDGLSRAGDAAVDQ